MKTKINKMELIAANAAAVKAGQTKTEFAESFGMSVTSVGQALSNYRAVCRKALIASGKTRDEANILIKDKIPTFPRGRTTGSGEANAELISSLFGDVL